MRHRQLRERAAAQVAEREGAGDQARVAAHRAPHGRALGACRRHLVPGGEDVEHVVVERDEIHVGNRLAAGDALLLPVDRLAGILRPADQHQRAAALEREQQLALEQEHRLRRPQLVAERVAATRRALHDRPAVELGQPLGRQARQRREVGKLLRRDH